MPVWEDDLILAGSILPEILSDLFDDAGTTGAYGISVNTLVAGAR
jgi:hypothetical protein